MTFPSSNTMLDLHGTMYATGRNNHIFNELSLKEPSCKDNEPDTDVIKAFGLQQIPNHLLNLN